MRSDQTRPVEPADRRLLPIGGEELSEQLHGAGKSTIYGLVKSGHLVRIHIGKRAFVTQESVNQFIDKQIAAAKAGSV